MGVSYSVLSNKKLITITTFLVQVCPNVHTIILCCSLAALPPVFVPTNVHHDIPAVLPSLAEDTLPENVILPSGDPPQAFPGEQTHDLDCFWVTEYFTRIIYYIIVISRA